MEIMYDEIIEDYSNDINEVIKNKNKYYHSFCIPKRNGGKRYISEPLGKLKDLQKMIYSDIFYPKSYLIHKCAYAYVPNRNIRECIDKHIEKSVVLKIDIKDFFTSITEKHIVDSFKYAFRMSDASAKIIADLCTLNERLPQGAVTSPIISNFVCRILDRRFYEYCNKNYIEYSRYADDLIFSGDFDTTALLHYASWALRDYYSFKINYSKLRVMKKHQRQIVLGVLVNEQCRLNKEKRHELRQALYYIKKYGAEDYISRTGCNIERLIGYVNYAVYINNEPSITELRDLLLSYIREI